ncbi:MAG: von Willebrand factor type A domain-containing protein [Opitutae bacterium]|nr:von Willebrand factor type A domain-containing protein [Opitutae bacterium]
MNPNPLSPRDPRLTAYALGEMEPAERDEFERLLQGDAAARATAEEIRATAGLLGTALAHESAVATEPKMNLAEITAQAKTRDFYAPKRQPGQLLRFPQLYYVTAGLAAACFAVFFVVRESREQQALQAKKGLVVHTARERGVASASMPVAMPAVADAATVRQLALLPAGASVEDRFFATAEAATSSFPLRVGRESYDEVRTQLQRGQRPARARVQVAEMINAFHYNCPEPQANEAFASVLEEAESPWSPGHRLVRVGLKGRDDAAGVLARDARVEVDFNPARVRAWRLIGFERDGNTMGVRGGMTGDTMQAGDTVTALYEVVPADGSAPGATLLTLSLHYTEPASGEARTYERTLAAGTTAFENASADFKFAAAVASFGLRLKDSRVQVPVTLEQVAQWATAGSQGAPERQEFVGLVQLSQVLLHE